MSERHAGFSGIVATALFAVGYFLAGSPPKFNASAGTIQAFYTDHHRALLIGMILTGLGAAFFVWFAAHLAGHLRAAGQTGLAAVLGMGAVAMVAIVAIGDALNLALTQMARGGTGGGVIRALYQVAGMTYGRFFWFALLVAIPVALASQRKALPSYLWLVGMVQLVLFVLGGVSLKSHGFFGAGDTMTMIALIGFLAGTALTSWAVWQEDMHAAHSHHSHHHAAPTPA